MENTRLYPIRYFSIVTVPKEFTHQLPKIENEALRGGASLNGKDILDAIEGSKSCVASLTPYLFVLFEIENGGAYWTYLDMAGELSKIKFTDGTQNEIAAEKVTFTNGGYMYVMKEVHLVRS